MGYVVGGYRSLRSSLLLRYFRDVSILLAVVLVHEYNCKSGLTITGRVWTHEMRFLNMTIAWLLLVLLAIIVASSGGIIAGIMPDTE